MKKINCRKNCKKTKQLRDSSKCMSIAFIKGDSIIYSCETNIKTPEEASFYNCEFIDNGITDHCESCNLKCIKKDKNSKRRFIRSKKNLEKNGFNLIEEDSSENKIAQYAKRIVSDGLSGKRLDIETFKYIYKIISKK